MDTFRQLVEVEADTFEEAAQKAMRLVPFGDVMQCDPIDDEPEQVEAARSKQPARRAGGSDES